MPYDFDDGYAAEPFRTLCRTYPDGTVYPQADFRTEWGPIFHRGRLDGSARIMVIGQDPAAHETIARRILIGAAGHRIQGFLAKLGINRSYVLINTFLYSVYGQGGGQKHAQDQKIASYRNKWFKALLQSGKIEAVVALGGLADSAWHTFIGSSVGKPYKQLPYQHITHPTWPDSSSKGNAAKLAANTATMLENWNQALTALQPKIAHPDASVSLKLYGASFQPGDLAAIPAVDLPAGCPAWMLTDSWARRTGATAAMKRRTITVTVPADVMTHS